MSTPLNTFACCFCSGNSRLVKKWNLFFEYVFLIIKKQLYIAHVLLLNYHFVPQFTQSIWSLLNLKQQSYTEKSEMLLSLAVVKALILQKIFLCVLGSTVCKYTRVHSISIPEDYLHGTQPLISEMSLITMGLLAVNQQKSLKFQCQICPRLILLCFSRQKPSLEELRFPLSVLPWAGIF